MNQIERNIWQAVRREIRAMRPTDPHSEIDLRTHIAVLILYPIEFSRESRGEIGRSLNAHLRIDRQLEGINRHSREHARGIHTGLILRYFDPVYGFGNNGNGIELRPRKSWAQLRIKMLQNPEEPTL